MIKLKTLRKYYTYKANKMNREDCLNKLVEIQGRHIKRREKLHIDGPYNPNTIDKLIENDIEDCIIEVAILKRLAYRNPF